MDEFQEADILWPDDTDDDLLPPPLALMEEEPGSSSVSSGGAPVLFGRYLDEGSFFPRCADTSSSAGEVPGVGDSDEEEWQEADVLWPDTVGVGPGPREGCAGGFARACRRVKKPATAAAAARREGWTTGPPASSPIDIPGNVAPRRRLAAAMMMTRRF